MAWLRTKNRRYICTLALFSCLGLSIIGLGRITNPARDDMSCGTCCDIAKLFTPGIPTYATIPGLESKKQFSIFDFPFPKYLDRGLLSSRGGDPRQFKDVLASDEIELRSDTDELANVQIAAQAIDGIIVRPCEVFSFNATVGPRTEDRGFRSGLMFERGEVVSGVGGGICIVSTALFNAAARSGLKILDRGPHSGPVRYAEPGMDAAVVYGCKDMSFKNDTDTPVMIRSTADGDRLTVSVMGKKQPGRSVEIVQKDYTELPFKVIEKEDSTIPEGTVEVKSPARTGFEVTVVRRIKQNGKLVQRDILSHDRIAPRDKVVLIPPKPKGSTPVVASTDVKIGPHLPVNRPETDAAKTEEPASAMPNTSQPYGSIEVKLGIPMQADKK